jgi:multicomponent Na+:H+ antiporter subunit D
VLADGLVKAALFTCVGIVEHRRLHLDQRRLHGTCRDLPFTGVVFALGALALAALPPFGTFLGKALIGGAATHEGLGWLPAFIALTSALTSAAVLRAAGSVFLGVGPSDPGGEPAEDEVTEPETAEHERTPPTMIIPAIVLLLAALAAGVWTGLADAATAAAERFIDTAAYAGAVLQGAPGTIPGRVDVPAPVGIDYVYAAAATLGAVGLAALLLLRPPRRSERAPIRAGLAALGRLRDLHSGHPGDYVAWIVVGTAALGGMLAALGLA